jgi:hypothetical protein
VDGFGAEGVEEADGSSLHGFEERVYFPGSRRVWPFAPPDGCCPNPFYAWRNVAMKEMLVLKRRQVVIFGSCSFSVYGQEGESIVSADGFFALTERAGNIVTVRAIVRSQSIVVAASRHYQFRCQGVKQEEKRTTGARERREEDQLAKHMNDRHR